MNKYIISLKKKVTINKKNENKGSRICAIVLAIIPVASAYKDIVGISVVTFLLLLLLPYLLLKMRFNLVTLKEIAILGIFLLYRLINHGTNLNEFLISFIIFIYVYALITCIIDANCFLQTVLLISKLAIVALIIQYIGHYIFDTHIRYFITAFLNEDNVTSLNLTGMSNGRYRPSAFFLEPSHLAAYIIPVILILLFENKTDRKNINTALFLSIGIVLSTSGMGIVLVLLMWIVYYISVIGKGTKRSIINGLLFIASFVFIVLVLYFNVEIFRYSIQRIFVADSGKIYNALEGRTAGGALIVSKMKKWELIFGMEESADSSLYLSGLYRVLIQEGIIGTLLFNIVFLYQAIKRKGVQGIICVYIMVSNLYINNYDFAYLIICLVYAFGQKGKVSLKTSKRE